MTPLSSSNLSGYEYEKGTLTIYFSNGSVYTYFNVPETTVNNLDSAPSAGKYFHTSIKSNYAFSRKN